jgi:hypothetical protein
MSYKFWIMCGVCVACGFNLEARQAFQNDSQDATDPQTVSAKTGESDVDEEELNALPPVGDLSEADEIENSFVLVGSAETSEKQTSGGSAYAAGLTPNATLSKADLAKVKRLDEQKKKKVTLEEVSVSAQSSQDPRQEILEQIQKAKDLLKSLP